MYNHVIHRMTEAEKKAFYDSEFKGAPLAALLAFRCTLPLATWLKSKGMEEKKEYTAVIRRLLIKAAKEEGFDPNGI